VAVVDPDAPVDPVIKVDFDKEAAVVLAVLEPVDAAELPDEAAEADEADEAEEADEEALPDVAAMTLVALPVGLAVLVPIDVEGAPSVIWEVE